MPFTSKKLTQSIKQLLLLGVFLITASSAFAHSLTVNLIVAYKLVDFAGKSVEAIAVNNQIPAPTLHFKQGDTVTLNVYNHLNVGTTIHWHGLIVPWQMDGVEGVSQLAIPPGGMFAYHFTLYQSGTYWYHAHAGFQEQQGLYGAFIIDPPKPPAYHYNKDYVVLLSDWSNTNPARIFANLKKDGDYYAPRFPLQPSLIHFIHDYRKSTPAERKQLIDNYKMMQQMRMSIYDFSDVAYDAFLLNGQPSTKPWTALVKVGDIVRLRFIGAGGSTIFHVKIPGTAMQLVQVDGNDVKPENISDFTIASGETYDVLVKIQKDEPYIIYAESADTVGAALGALVTHPNQRVLYQTVIPFPEPIPVTQEMMANMSSTMHGSMSMNPDLTSNANNLHAKMTMNNSLMKTSSNSTMPIASSNSSTMQAISHNTMADMPMNHAEHGSQLIKSSNTKTEEPMPGMTDRQNAPAQSSMSMNMPTEPTIIGDNFSVPNADEAITSGTKYQNLVAAVKTNDPAKPIAGVIRMQLFGYMDRYIWFINGQTEAQAKPIIIQPGKRYRIIFTNDSMMHHPMHIHGHWFILRNGHGAYDPLLHTIDVAPGATVVVDIDADASGQWFFHCHHLYHMMSGMARVFQYTTIIDISKGKAQPKFSEQAGPYTNRPILRDDTALPIDQNLINHPVGHAANLYLASFLDIGQSPVSNLQQITFKGLYGGDYNKLELYTNDAEINKGNIENADMDIFYWHLLSQFWAIKGGLNYTFRPAKTGYWQPGIGIEGLMPYFIDTNVRVYNHDNITKLDVDLSRDTQISNNFFIRTGVQGIFASHTVVQDDIGSGLNQIQYTLRPYYRLMPGVNLYTEFEHDQDYGALKTITRNTGQSTVNNTLTIGVALLF